MIFGNETFKDAAKRYGKALKSDLVRAEENAQQALIYWLYHADEWVKANKKMLAQGAAAMGATFFVWFVFCG